MGKSKTGNHAAQAEEKRKVRLAKVQAYFAQKAVAAKTATTMASANADLQTKSALYAVAQKKTLKFKGLMEKSQAKFAKYTGFLAKAKADYKTARGVMAGKVTAALEAQKASAALWAARVAKATKAAGDVAAKEQTAATGANTAAVVAKRKSK